MMKMESALTLPCEPEERVLREAARALAAQRDGLARALERAEAEDVQARLELRFPRHAEGTPAELRRRALDLDGLIEWLDYRADMRGAW